MVAVLPYTHYESDFIVPPHAAIAVPYWLTMVAGGFGILRCTGLLGTLAPYCRFGIAAWTAIALVALVFLALNAIPDAGRPGAHIDPQNAFEWCQLIFFPSAWPDIELRYGFPFIWYELGLINGESVKLYHGAEMELLQHRLAENICIALGTMMICGMAVQWLVGRRQTPAPPTEQEAGSAAT
jgi:hypothetical protein